MVEISYKRLSCGQKLEKHECIYHRDDHDSSQECIRQALSESKEHELGMLFVVVDMVMSSYFRPRLPGNKRHKVPSVVLEQSRSW